MQDNPWLKVPDPYEEIKPNQKLAAEYEQEFERLCWSVFHQSIDGKALFDALSKRYLLQTQINPMSPTASNEAIWWDGFKCAVVGLHTLGAKHIRRVNSEVPHE